MFTADFHGKNIVITGASHGLGRAMAVAFSRMGANLALLARREKHLLETESLLQNKKALLLPGDISKSKDIESACLKISEHYGHVDILINNAAGWASGKLEEISVDDIEKIISTTILGSILMTKYILPVLEKSTQPQLLHVISTAGLPGSSFNPAHATSAYFAAKWGQAGFSETVRQELKSKKVKVTTFYPGSFDNNSTLDDAENDSKKMMSVKDVVEVAIFALSRSERCSLDTVVLRET